MRSGRSSFKINSNLPHSLKYRSKGRRSTYIKDFMTDLLSTFRRSENMSRIRAKDTKPEMLVRRLLHSLGYRYRLHTKDLPGKPDIVFRRPKKVILVHGCFWHQHNKCREGRLPGTRQDYWVPKLGRNVNRDREQRESLEAAGWQILVLWECEITDPETLKTRLLAFLK